MEVKNELQALLQDCYGFINELHKTADMTEMKDDLARQSHLTKDKVKGLGIYLHRLVDLFEARAETMVNTVTATKAETLDSHSSELMQCLEYLSKMCVITEDLIKMKGDCCGNPGFASKLKMELSNGLKECKELRLIDYDMFTSVDAEINMTQLFKTPFMSIVSKSSLSNLKSELCSMGLEDTEGSKFQVPLSNGPSIEADSGNESLPSTGTAPDNFAEEYTSLLQTQGNALATIPEGPEEDGSPAYRTNAFFCPAASDKRVQEITSALEGLELSAARSPAAAAESFPELAGGLIKEEIEDSFASSETTKSLHVMEPAINASVPAGSKSSRRQPHGSTVDALLSENKENVHSTGKTSQKVPSSNAVSEHNSTRIVNTIPSSPVGSAGDGDVALARVEKSECAKPKTTNQVVLQKQIADKADSISKVLQSTQIIKQEYTSHAPLKCSAAYNNLKSGVQKNRDLEQTEKTSHQKLPINQTSLKEEIKETNTLDVINQEGRHGKKGTEKNQPIQVSQHQTESKDLTYVQPAGSIARAQNTGQHNTHAKSSDMRFDLKSFVSWTGTPVPEIQAVHVQTINGGTSTRFDFPIGCCLLRDGRLVVADTGNNLVKIMIGNDLQMTLGKKAGVKFFRPSAVAADRNDYIYVKDDLCVQIFNVEGKHQKTIGKKVFAYPYGLALIEDPKLGPVLFVLDVDFSSPRLHRYLIREGQLQSCEYRPLCLYGTTTSKLRFFAVHQGMMLCSDLGASTMFLSDTDGGAIGAFGNYGHQPGEFAEPSGVAADAVGNWLVGDSKNNRVQAFDKNGNFMAVVKFSSPIRRPSGIHLSADGTLYVINYLDQCVKVYHVANPW